MGNQTNIVVICVLILWALIAVVQLFLSYGTAYRCTKKGADNGSALFIYLIGFGLAALIPGLGLHYYIKHLQTKIIIQQAPKQEVVRVIDPTQLQAQQIQQQQNNEAYQRQLDMRAYQAYQQQLQQQAIYRQQMQQQAPPVSSQSDKQ